MDNEKENVLKFTNEVIKVSEKFIKKVRDGRARSVETYQDMQDIRNLALLLKKRLNAE